MVALLPWRITAPLGSTVGALVGSVLRVRRRHVVRAMLRARVADPRRAARAMYASLGRGVFELLWMAGASPSRRSMVLARHVSVHAALLDDALAHGPVVLLASHTGNWELAAAAAAELLAARGRSLAIVAKPFSSAGFDAFMVRLRSRLGLRVVRPSGAMEAVRQELRAGGCVAMPIDQVPDRRAHGIAVEFLGGAALVDRAPFVLARRARATMLVVAASRVAVRHDVEVLATLPAPMTAQGVEASLKSATRALEAFVRRSPSSWLWLHRRWRGPRDGLIETVWTTRSSSPVDASRAA